MYLCVLCVFCWQSPEEGLDSPETGGADSCELLSECWPGTEPGPSGGATPALKSTVLLETEFS